MTNPMPVSLVGNIPLSGHHTPQAYYRSKLFTAPFTTNPLIAAASPLFSLLERLHVSPSLPPIHSIRDNIDHELQAFHSRLDSTTCTDELSTIAHYLLCATIDELLGKSYLRHQGQPAEFQAFTAISYDESGPEIRFFDIVSHIKERPHQYLDLIELAYYCLITGFEGRYHQKVDGRLQLDNLIDELFQLIQYHRVNKPHLLFKEPQKIDITPKNHKSLIILGVIFLSLVLAGFSINYLLLEKKAKAVQISHTVIDQLDN